jgi:hypothetical protein
MKVYVPTGRKSDSRAEAAPPLAHLSGKAILLFDNGKWNGGRVLRHLGDLLMAEQPGLELRMERKPHFSRTAEPDLVGRLAGRRPDAIVTAIGD